MKHITLLFIVSLTIFSCSSTKEITKKIDNNIVEQEYKAIKIKDSDQFIILPN